MMKRTVLRSFLSLGLVVTMLASLPSEARATFPYLFGGPAAFAIPGLSLPPPIVVPGKEFSEFTDRDMAGVLDLEQVIAWDGNPFKAPPAPFPAAGVLDTFDYSDSRPTTFPDPETDAIANLGDNLFIWLFNPGETGGFPNATNLLYSIGSLSVSPPPIGGPVATGVGVIGGTGDISFETAAGAHGLWASGPVDIDSMAPPRDVDGLEVWGGEPPSGPVNDANRYSHDVDAVSSVSVWAFDDSITTSTPYIFHATIVTAVTDLLGPLPADIDPDDIDLDALMAWDPSAGGFDPGDSILFSIDQLPTMDDAAHPDGFYATGGEIFTLEVLPDAIASGFLFHGGHFWDHDWTHTFFVGADGVPLNLNALEAASVPEPSTLTLAGLALLGLVAYGWRRRRRA